MRVISLFLSFFFIITLSFAQSPQEELASLRKKYPKEGLVFLKRSEKIVINIEKGELKVKTSMYEEQMILEDKYSAASKRSVEYNSFSSIDALEAYTLVPEDKKYKKKKVKEFKTKDVLDGAIFHNDIKEISFHYPSLQVGAKKVISYEEELTEPRFLGGYFWSSYIPTEYAEYVIDTDENVDVAIKFFNINESDLTLEESHENGRIVKKYTLKDSKGIITESGAPNVRYYAPHSLTHIKSFTVNGKKQNLLSTPKDLHDWYYSLVKDINKDDKSELKSIADSITIGLEKEVDKVKAVYQWVQNNIKYVAFEDGLGGFVPRNASQVCSKRFGDCKDMASIITSMLAEIGVEAHLVWIGSNHIPYKYSEVPSPTVDNHMIAAYEHSGEYIFLDATGSNTPFGFPSSFIQGKEAMVDLGDGGFKIVEVPIVNPERNQIADTVYLKIEKDHLNGEGKLTLSGYYKEHLTQQLTSIDSKTAKDEFYKSYLEKGSNKFLVNNYSEKNLRDKDDPIKIAYDFNINDYVRRNDDEIYLNLNLDKVLFNSDVEPDRKLPYMKRFKSQFSYVNRLKIPEGYSVSFIPENASFQHEQFNYSIKYNNDGNYLDYNFIVEQNYLMLEKDHFKEWNSFIKSLRNAYNEAVILKKK